MSEEKIPTSEKLARALEAAGAPKEMIEKARAYHYDDYQSELAFPIRQLADDAARCGLDDIALRALNGDFDGTKEESDQWARSADGQATFAEFFKMKKR